jgi:hypothetical protein
MWFLPESRPSFPLNLGAKEAAFEINPLPFTSVVNATGLHNLAERITGNI